MHLLTPGLKGAEMADFPPLSYTSTSEIPTLSYTKSLKKVPLSGGLGKGSRANGLIDYFVLT